VKILELLKEGGMKDEKLKTFFYDGSCVYGFAFGNRFLSNAGVWTAQVHIKI
jgi:hypothetical protein